MKIWYSVVCDIHKEFTDVMVDNPIRTELYLGKKAQSIHNWLADHRLCDLRLICRDDQSEKVYEDGYKKIRFEDDKKDENWGDEPKDVLRDIPVLKIVQESYRD